MFANQRFENSRFDGGSILEVAGGEDEPRRFVPLKRSRLDGEVIGPLADLRLTQIFGFGRDAFDGVIEAQYRFPLPGDAAVRGVTVRFGDVEIRAELKEREQAEADYETAVAQGRQAAFASRESPDVFTLRIAGIAPDVEVTVETAYVQIAAADGPNWTLRIPLTTAPRYVRQDEIGSRSAQGQPLAIMRDPGHRFSLDLRFANADLVRSATHKLRVENDAGNESETVVRVRLEDGEVVPDRDAVLTWQAVKQEQHPALHVLLHDDKADDEVYFLALLSPPSQPHTGAGVPREAVLLVDHSGSMEGAKWQASDWAVKQFLGGLEPQDTFALGLFHSSTKWFAPKLMHGSTEIISRAITFLEKNTDSGGTELGVALEQALDIKRGSGECSRHVLILTDAEVSDAGRLLRLAEGEAKRGAEARRISVLCIDAAPNAYLARELAERGGGVARFLTSAPEEEDITTALDAILEDWAAPLLTGLKLEVSRESVFAIGRATGKASRSGASVVDIGDLPAGRAVWVAGRVSRSNTPDLAFRIIGADGREFAAARRDLNNPAHTHPAIKALFGARQVLNLEQLVTAGYDDKELRAALTRLGYTADEFEAQHNGASKLYAENRRQDAQTDLKGLIVRESLRYGTASSETAFIAARTEAGKPVEAVAVVANALPAGWNEPYAPGFGGTLMSAMAAPRGGAAYPMAMAPPPMPSPAPMHDASIGGKLKRAFGGGRSRSPQPPAAASPFDFAKSAPAQDAALYEEVAEMDWMESESSSTMQGGIASALPEPGSLFAGTPAFVAGEAVLFDNTRPENKSGISSSGLLTALELRLSDNAAAQNVDSGLLLLLYVDDLAVPRVRVRLSDLLRQGGKRPLNIQYHSGQAIKLVLQDANGVWKVNPPALMIDLK